MHFTFIAVAPILDVVFLSYQFAFFVRKLRAGGRVQPMFQGEEGLSADQAQQPEQTSPDGHSSSEEGLSCSPGAAQSSWLLALSPSPFYLRLHLHSLINMLLQPFREVFPAYAIFRTLVKLHKSQVLRKGYYSNNALTLHLSACCQPDIDRECNL